jgi:hypothetical protein
MDQPKCVSCREVEEKAEVIKGEHRKGEEVEAWLLEMKKYF